MLLPTQGYISVGQSIASTALDLHKPTRTSATRRQRDGRTDPYSLGQEWECWARFKSIIQEELGLSDDRMEFMLQRHREDAME